VQVEFENITYSTEVPLREAAIPTVASAFLNIAARKETRTHSVLQVGAQHGRLRSLCLAMPGPFLRRLPGSVRTHSWCSC
jgi:hypothetical protein